MIEDSQLKQSQRLLDENEQLRTSLESALDENGRLVEDRDRLLRRVAALARELQASNVSVRHDAPLPPMEAAEEKASQAEEELRVAFEELQVMTEELEVANTALHQTNAELESRVEQRTAELTRTNTALGKSEAAFRTLIEGMPQLAWRSANGGEWTWSGPQWTDFTGQSAEDSIGQGWLAALHPDDRAAAQAAWQRADAKHPLQFEARICHAAEQRYRHFQTRAAPVLSERGEVLEWLGTSTDVDDLLRLQNEQSVLVAELQHRTRNLMAVIQAVMLRTIKGSSTLQDFAKCIDDRLQALARAQGLLSQRGSGMRVAFDELLRRELGAHAPLDDLGNAAQISTSGPTGIPLRSSIVQTLALAIHELATNATKYGALSTPQGHLEVRWSLLESETEPVRLLVEWQETGVENMPEVKAAPRGGGYGRELIERALPYQLGARTSYGFGADGIRCTIEVVVPDQIDQLEVSRG